MDINSEEKEIIIQSLQFYINNLEHLSYVDLNKISDLKERIRVLL